jgi:arylsulfatase
MRFSPAAFLPPLLLAALGLPASAAEPAQKPNVLIVLVDDAGYGDFSCHGNPVVKTPSIDKLHAESVRFTDFHVCPMCTPTRGQLMTGVDNLRNGAMNVSSGRTLLRRGIPTAADVFAANGYKTGHFGKWHLGDNYPYRPQDRGFHETIHCKSWGMASAADWWNNECFDDHYWHGGQAEQFPGYNTDAFFGEAMKWMKARHDHKEPFFVYLPLTAVHAPHFVPEKYKEPLQGKKLNANQVGFFGMILNLDENVAKLEAMLKAEGLRDDTVLVFMTDNGGTAGVPVYNAGMRGGKTTLYEGGHRVPCFVRWPAGRLRPAGDVAGVTQCQDVLPTLIELCGLKAPAGAAFDGASLAKVLRDEKEAVPDRTLVVQYSRIQPQQRPQKGDACVMWRRWRLVGDKELYDLKADPAQKENVFEKHADVVKKLREHYDKWWAGVEKGLDEFQPISVGSEAEAVTRLSPCDWEDVHCDQSAQVRKGEKKNGPWNLMVERDGEYEVRLRRWPKESDLAMTAASPAFKGKIGQYPEGVALPVAKARLKVGDFDKTAEVKKDDKGVTFAVALKKGRTKLQTWLLDADGKELCGAYYAEVRRK